MDALSVLALATQCVTAAPAPVVAALALAESNGSAYAIEIAGEHRDAGDLDSAVQAVASALVEGTSVKVGLAQVPVTAFDVRQISYTEGFSPCRNLSIAGEVLSEAWELYGGLEEHWRLAALEYSTGEPGIEGEFAQRFDAALSEVTAAAAQLPAQAQAAAANQSSPPNQVQTRHTLQTQSAEPADTDWNVYSRDRSRSLLIFSR